MCIKIQVLTVDCDSRFQTDRITDCESKLALVNPALCLIGHGISVRCLFQRVTDIKISVVEQFWIVDFLRTDVPLYGGQFALCLDFEVADEADGVTDVDVLWRTL